MRKFFVLIFLLIFISMPLAGFYGCGEPEYLGEIIVPGSNSDENKNNSTTPNDKQPTNPSTDEPSTDESTNPFTNDEIKNIADQIKEVLSSIDNLKIAGYSSNFDNNKRLIISFATEITLGLDLKGEINDKLTSLNLEGLEIKSNSEANTIYVYITKKIT